MRWGRRAIEVPLPKAEGDCADVISFSPPFASHEGHGTRKNSQVGKLALMSPVKSGTRICRPDLEIAVGSG